MTKTIYAILLIIIVLALAGYWLFVYKSPAVNNNKTPAITNFDECAAAGNPIMESYPRQCNANGQTFTETIPASLNADGARLIAANNKECGIVGVLSGQYTYNENSKTWWFDIERNLELGDDGCNPACVVSDLTKTAEVNLRCTGLIEPSEPAGEKIRQLFTQKYPTYAETLTVRIAQETASHVRGTIVFVDGEPGGIFLAAKIDGNWQIVHDGNGEIPCSLSSYGFPNDMLSDCAAE
ncbi:MAG: hypothetical protein HY764_01360 [Candidatus Portnoybacteria bacterium]|nr:hypothetical protein [Candidatus Portnoybacteria bacterium]